MWQPKYTIRNRLLRTIREIGEALGEIRATGLSKTQMSSLVVEARALSSYASTSIEGNPLPLTDVKRLLKNSPEHIRDTEREILNYNEALKWLQNELKENKFIPSTTNFERLQGQVVNGLMDNPHDVGNIRQNPVVIRNPAKIDEVVFMPRDHQEVGDLCDELFEFVQSNLGEMDPVLLAGLFHKQAVIVHPFMDGNGRSTRLMTMSILGLSGLDFFPIFSFEYYYNRNVTRYFNMVGESGDYYDLKDELDFTPWLEYFAEGILDELKRVQKTLQAKAPRLESHHQELLTYLSEHGSITQREYGSISNRSLAARKNDFSKLVSLGLIESKGKGRSLYYVLTTEDQD